MKVNYDPTADVMYINLSDKKSTKTVEVEDDLYLDYNSGVLVGIEILDASKKLSKKEMKEITFRIPTYTGTGSKTSFLSD